MSNEQSNTVRGQRAHDIIDFGSARDDFDEGRYETPPEPEPWTEVAVGSDDDPSAYQEISIEQSSAESDESVETGNRRLNIEMPGTAFKLYGASVLVLRVVSDGRPYGRVLYKNSIKNLLDRHVETRTCRAGFA
ncbi:uncharacterized protein VDAG_05131 [Verticillium dahliae VdLs.17]|uniref:Uncharacterized protein n=1 Tax=Verticillium dahliae (strain VdLs.17 / ATCC MYA-4575 / FGSC 10137) TaxID=498257 RepID=G2X4P9_VERDV|nr:uncharacterized protein VDAG_05131 [Verticillium dahliae VdLs.17]EGY23693.1 hypothetical protein VDAG_05131 [Verticillium dahliae VdLs.17]KAH6708575.1 hypothetical protein EV126DRAFT_332106 [Verticillium dahliae]